MTALNHVQDGTHFHPERYPDENDGEMRGESEVPGGGS